jgi:hypothetical protein
VLTNPFGANVPVIGWAEVFYNNKWSKTGWVYSDFAGALGVDVSYVQGEGIIVQTGNGIIFQTGGGHGDTTNIASAPCRVFIQKLGA